MTTQFLITTAIQVGIVVIGGIVAYYTFVAKITAALAKVAERVTVIENRCITHVEVLARVDVLGRDLEKVKSENLIFWKVIEPHLGGIIHSPVHRERDELVDRLIDGDLTRDEGVELKRRLELALTDPNWPAEKKLAAALLLARVAARLGSE